MNAPVQVDYVDVWTDHTPYPFNQLPKTYSFMVRNSLIWRIGYYGQQPRFIHVPTQTVSSLFVSKQVAAAFDHYQPDLVVSVHPLMQLVPLRVLRQQARRAAVQLACDCLHRGTCMPPHLHCHKPVEGTLKAHRLPPGEGSGSLCHLPQW